MMAFRVAVLMVFASSVLAHAEPTGTFEVGAGYNSDDGYLAHAGASQSNLFGTGHGLYLWADISELRQQFGAAYEVPDLGDGWDLRVELLARERRYADFLRQGAGGSITLGRTVAPHTRVFFRYRAEHVTVVPLPSDLPVGRALGGEVGDGIISAAGAGIAYDTRDRIDGPRSGSRLALYVERATPLLGSEADYLRIDAAADHARPLGPFTLRLGGRASYLRAGGPDAFPISERLFHDGHADVRGYGLGAVDPGASFKALGRVELELPVWKRAGLSIAGFADAGVRGNDDPAWGPRGLTLQRSVGLSIIWRSPIGKLQFDWAVPLDGPARVPQFLFGVGGTF